MDDIATRAALSALSSGISNRYWVAEVKAVYVYASGSSATANGWTVLTSAAAGRFLLESDELTLPILGGTSDDWVNCAAASVATAAAGVTLKLGAGTYLAKTRQLIANYSHIVCNPKTVIHTTITNVDNRDSTFSAFAQILGSDATALDTMIGDRTFKIAGAMTFAVGDFVILNSKQFRNAMYQIRAWNGGTKVATVDRPLKMPYGGPLALTSFPAGSLVQKVTPAIGIVIELNGTTIYGACNRFFEIWGGWKCYVHGPATCGDGTSTTATERIISFDCPSYDCHAFDITADGANTTQLGISFEAAEACSYTRCDMKRMTNVGLIYQDGIGCSARDCKIEDSAGIGASFTAATAGSEPGSGSVWGSHGCRIDGGSYSGNAIGINAERGSIGSRVEGAAFVIGNTTQGFADNDASDTSVGGGAIIKSNVTGLFIDATSGRMRVDNTVCLLGNATAVLVGGGASLASVSAKLLLNTLSVNAFGAINLDAGSVVTDAAHTTPAIEIGGAGSVTGRFDLIYQAVAATGAINSQGALEFSGTLVSQVGGIGIQAFNSATVAIGSTAVIVGHGSGGRGIDLLDSAIAVIHPGASVESSAVRCENADNSTADLIPIYFSKHLAS